MTRDNSTLSYETLNRNSCVQPVAHFTLTSFFSYAVLPAFFLILLMIFAMAGFRCNMLLFCSFYYGSITAVSC